MKRVIVSRRQVLRGAGGFTLTLPFLPSLVPVPAYAATAVMARQPRFVTMASGHGGVNASNMYPADSLLTDSMQLYSGHTIRWGKLQAATEDGKTVLSPVMQAPSNKLTPALLAKMNVIRGLDIPWYIAHHSGGHLGNYAQNAGNGADGVLVNGKPLPTIDQLLAYSDKFYTSMNGIRERSILTGTLELSFNFSNATARTGAIQAIDREPNPQNLFRNIFDPGNTTPAPVGQPPRPPIVDRVLENYRRLNQSNRRLSGDDKQRLSAHMDRLFELEMKLKAAPVQRAAACKDLKSPAAVMGRAYYAALNDVIAAAFICGTSRIAVVGIEEPIFGSAMQDNWHEGVAHKFDTTGQPLLVEANRGVFSDVFVDLMAKLDVEDHDGHTILDNTFMKWTSECGAMTHDATSLPTFTAGSGAGAFETGRYIDYRNMTTRGRVMSYGAYVDNGGLTQNQLFATILQAFGLPPSDWQGLPNNGRAGYGYDLISPDYQKAYVPQVMANASTPLPLLTTA